MLHIKKIEDGIDLFKALGSDLRIQIIKLLLEKGEMNMNEIAGSLGITNGALTSHIKKLEECGLVSVLSEHEGHGNQKLCRVHTDRILIDVMPQVPEENKNLYSVDIPVGQYTDYQISPTCGIASRKGLIGEVDDPRYFAHPQRTNAGILWFSKGYVEYIIPNFLPPHCQIEQLILSVEIASEAPGTNNDWPSDITFFLNETPVGTWTSPGDLGARRGRLNPPSIPDGSTQYGLWVTWVVDQEGCWIDGERAGDTVIDQLHLMDAPFVKVRLGNKKDARYVGGFNLFGKHFGDYDQDLVMTVEY